MQTTGTRHLYRNGAKRFVELLRSGIIITDIGIRRDTKTGTHLWQQAETTHSILKVCVVDVHTTVAFLEIGNLAR